MIHESHYWKDDVSRRAELLRKRLQQTRWSERSTARMEQDLMLGFYSIRKLFESQKLTAALAQARVRLRVHQCRKPVTLLNRHAVHALYDLTAHTEEEREITFLCNQFIHSYVFVLTVSQRHKWEGVLLASDRERNRVVYHVSGREIIQVFAQVSHDQPNRAEMTFNAKRRDYDVHSTNSSEGHLISAIRDDGQADDFSPEAMGLATQSALCRGLPTIYNTESGKLAGGANSGS
jgi:hypothetical protein